MTRFCLAALPALLTLGACATNSTPVGSVPGCEGKCDGLSGFLPIAGPESLIHCELIASGSDKAVECSFEGVPTDFPIEVSAQVTLLTSGYTAPDGSLRPGQTASHDFTTAETFTVLDSISDQQLPVIVLVNMNMRGDNLLGDSISVSRRSDLREVQQTFTFARVGDDTPNLPLPFELWQVVFFASDDGSVRQASVGPQEVRLDPWQLFLDETVTNHEVGLSEIRGDTSTYWLPVDRESTQLAGRGRYCNSSNSGCADLSFVLEGPGVYKLSADGATHFDASDLTPPVDSGVGMDGGVDASGDGSIGSDAGRDSGPTCGTSGQAPCADGCAEGFDLDGSLCSACGTNGLRPCTDTGCADGHEEQAGFCFECGTDGQARCTSTGECAAGHRYIGSTCQACGSDGQTYCGTYSNPICNEGHRYDGTVCQACGSDGQTYCGTYSNPVCDAGHRYNGTVCQVCGSDGQTYCGTYSNPVCDGGHRYNGTVCQVCGGEGQTYCGTYSRPVCDPGLRYNGTTCVAE